MTAESCNRPLAEEERIRLWQEAGTLQTVRLTGEEQIRDLGVLPAQPVALDAIGSHRGAGHNTLGAAELEIGVFEGVQQGLQDEVVGMSEQHLIDPIQDMVPNGAGAVLATNGTRHEGHGPGQG